MAENMIDYLGIVILIQLFFATAITMYSYILPTDAKTYVQDFASISSSVDVQTITSDLRNNLESQRNIPIIEAGALVFYSGNIILDLLVNFILAVPEMVTLLINGIGLLINLDAYLVVQLQLFIGAILSISYILGLIQFVTNIRAKGTI